MSVLRHSSLSLRRMARRAGKVVRRTYTTVSAPLMQVAEQHVYQEVRAPMTDRGALPVAIALLGLSFSTYSTHQLMLTSTHSKGSKS